MAMFGSKKTDSLNDMAAPASTSGNSGNYSDNKVTILAGGTVFRGDIETPTNLRVDGKIVGNIISTSNVAVGKGGIVEGNVTASTLRVSGSLKGNIEVAVKLILDASASVSGDVKAKDITMESGATINGKITMDMSASAQDFNSLATSAVSNGVGTDDYPR